MTVVRHRLTFTTTTAALAALVASGCAGGSSSATGNSGRASSSPSAASSPSPSTRAVSHAKGHIAYGVFINNGVSMFVGNADGTDIGPLLAAGAGEGPSFSPDGKTIAFSVTDGGPIVGGLVNPDGSGFRKFRLPKGLSNLGCGIWSPDGKRLACESFDDEHPERNGVYTVRATDGQEARRLSKIREVPCAFSPDGTQLLVLHDNLADETDNTLAILNADGSGTEQVIRKGVDLSCDWSPDGQHLLAESHGQLLLLDLRGQGAAIPLAVPGATRGSFSPDGTHVIFSAKLNARTDIFTANVDGSELFQITDTPGQDEEFGAWGP